MNFFREWTIQISGVIVLGTIFDMIMTDGEMKKYVKTVLSFVLLLTLIRPVVNLSYENLVLDAIYETQADVTELYVEAEENQREDIVTMYKQKLEIKINEAIKKEFNTDIISEALINKNVPDLGKINEIKITAYANEGEVINSEKIKNYLKENVGIEKENIKIELKQR